MEKYLIIYIMYRYYTITYNYISQSLVLVNTMARFDFYFSLFTSSQNSKLLSNVGNGFIVIGLKLGAFIMAMFYCF